MISTEDVIRLMDENNISHMVIVGEPPERALELSEQSSGRIIPLLGLYQSHEDKTSWMQDAGLPEKIRLGIQQGDYKGIGEIHIFEADKQSPGFREILQLANQHELPVLLHGDRFVVNQAFKWFPGLIIVWAHLGEAPDTDLLEEMLIAYPNLYIDTSVRDVLIVKDGKLLPEWRALFMKFSKRFLVAIDTYYTPRWKNINKVTSSIRAWLSELPNDVSRKLSHENAADIFLEKF